MQLMALCAAADKVSAMCQKSTWERFFDAHAPIYEENEFTKNTAREVDFLLEELELPNSATPRSSINNKRSESCVWQL